MPSLAKINLLDFDRESLGYWLVGLGEKPFRARQIFQWIHQHGATDFDQMTNVSRLLRERLKDIAEIRAPEMLTEKTASDGVVKWILRLHDGNAVETVFIPDGNRGTLCISSQVGCALDCSFCSTGKQGFNRNLTVSEIIGQVWLAVQRLAPKYPPQTRAVTNVVLMGMGEPLLNVEPVISAMDIMLDDLGYNISKYRVTLSTSGLIPAMEELKRRSPVALAVSLHAPNDALRNELVPINKKYNLAKLMKTCQDYFEDEPRRSVTFEYVMLDGINDQPEHAEQLVDLVADINCKINLIPFNPFPLTHYRRSSDAAIKAFQARLGKAGLQTNVRRTRGDDIDAACGQLVGDVADRTKRSEKWMALNNIPIVLEAGELSEGGMS